MTRLFFVTGDSTVFFVTGDSAVFRYWCLCGFSLPVTRLFFVTGDSAVFSLLATRPFFVAGHSGVFSLLRTLVLSERSREVDTRLRVVWHAVRTGHSPAASDSLGSGSGVGRLGRLLLATQGLFTSRHIKIALYSNNMFRGITLRVKQTSVSHETCVY